MARLYADEDFPRPAVIALRKLGHDVLTASEAGKAGVSDPTALDYAIAAGRVVLTYNRRDFVRLHLARPGHAGMVVCTKDDDFEELAQRVHERILKEEPLTGKLVRVIRSSPPQGQHKQ